jgi:preprotein translocase subunit YajC
MKREKKIGDKVRLAGGFVVVITKIYNQSPKLAEITYPSGRTAIARVSELKNA